jgi:hypothetical protein
MSKQRDKKQLELFPGCDGIPLRRFLEERLGKPVSLVLTDNCTSVLSLRVRDEVLSVRLHRMFMNANGPVLDEIVSFLKNKKGKMPQFRKFVRENKANLLRKQPRKVAIRTTGTFHDLQELFSEINDKYFEGAITAAITWGLRSPRYSVRKRTLGSYSERSNTIRINPALDKKNVPDYYLAFVIYHEMLHAALGVATTGQRRIIHPREFRTREKLFKDYDRALRWEKGR